MYNLELVLESRDKTVGNSKRQIGYAPFFLELSKTAKVAPIKYLI